MLRKDNGPQQDQYSLLPALQAQETQCYDWLDSIFCKPEEQDILSNGFVPAWWLI